MYKFSYYQSKNDHVDVDAFNVTFPPNRFDDVDKACKDVLIWAIRHKEVKSIKIVDDEIHLHFIVERDRCYTGIYLYEADVEFIINAITNDMKIETFDTSMNSFAKAVLFFKEPYNDETDDCDIIEKLKIIAKRGNCINC